ncbi:DUF4350 domain-containing protein [Acrocarpospora catenulata]|uniref:DUF4350 domain-containing protein n=1 Tax=Acrocarpospora catenulata TaxID=2836182 RepID=UPI001BDA0E3E|nr:DUF4350 domain-containing protein [Acrocarpospora catenulata]
MSTPVSPRVRDRWRTWRAPLAVLALMLLLATVIVLLGRPRPGGYLDAEATTPQGAHALVALLGNEGVVVEQVRTVDEARAVADPGTLLVVARTEYLSGADLLAQIAALPGDRLLVEPLTEALEALAPGVTAGDYQSSTVRVPGCGLRAATLAGSALTGGEGYQATGATTCYEGTLLRHQRDGRTVTVLGSGEFLSNARLAEDGNAALAMNLTGAHPRVVWFVPVSVQGTGEGTATLGELIPGRVSWAVLALVLAVVLVALWQGRRLGPVVTERLPVVVRAAETAEGRGRLYRARRARDRAGHALRAAALNRLVPRLGLTATATPDAIVSAVAARIGQDAGQIRAILYGSAPADDARLVALARNLDIIERQVRDS